jgi:hypothetical protein
LQLLHEFIVVILVVQFLVFIQLFAFFEFAVEFKLALVLLVPESQLLVTFAAAFQFQLSIEFQLVIEFRIVGFRIVGFAPPRVFCSAWSAPPRGPPARPRLADRLERQRGAVSRAAVQQRMAASPPCRRHGGRRGRRKQCRPVRA